MATAQDLLAKRTTIQGEIDALKNRIQARMYEANFNLDIASKGEDVTINELRAQIKPLAEQVKDINKDINTQMAALSAKEGGSRSRSRSRSRSKGRRSRKQGQGRSRKTRRSRS